MKEIVLAAFFALLLTGCASEYLIVTNDGTVISTDSKPELDNDSGMIEFEDSEGREQQLPKDSIKTIIER